MKSLILLIDDDSIAHIINRRIITRSFPDDIIKEFLSASRAIDFLKNLEQIESFHFIIFLDINMPEISGWEFMTILEEKFCLDYQIHLLTSSVNEKDKVKAKEFEQVRSFIQKPFSIGKLQEFELHLENSFKRSPRYRSAKL